MRVYEGQIRRAVDAGETVTYTVTPKYKGNNLLPDSMELNVTGSNGFQFTHRDTQALTNKVSFSNKPK